MPVFSVLFSIVITSLGEERAGLCDSRAFVCLFCMRQFMSFFSFSWCQRLAAAGVWHSLDFSINFYWSKSGWTKLISWLPLDWNFNFAYKKQTKKNNNWLQPRKHKANTTIQRPVRSNPAIHSDANTDFLSRDKTQMEDKAITDRQIITYYTPSFNHKSNHLSRYDQPENIDKNITYQCFPETNHLTDRRLQSYG